MGISENKNSEHEKIAEDGKRLGGFARSLEQTVWRIKVRVLNMLNRNSENQISLRRPVMKKRMINLSVAACFVIACSVACLAFLKNEPPREVEPAETIAMGKADAPAGMVALEIELPAPVPIPTPKAPPTMENLEPPRPSGQGRPVFYVPAGTINVAMGKPVTSSSLVPIVGELEYITNGDKEGTDGSFVELDPFEQHVTIDLEAMYEIYAIVLWHYHKDDVYVYNDVVVQSGIDPDFVKDAEILFNNDIDNSLGLGAGNDKLYIDSYEGKLIDAKGVTARYLRFHSNGNNLNEMNHYIEIEVYGKRSGQ